MNKTGILFFSYIMLGTIIAAHASVLVEGNAQNDTETFAFPIEQTAASINGEFFYAAASPSVAGLGLANNYAIARVVRDARAFMPITPQKITLNDVPDQPNPFFDQGVAFLSLMQGGEVDLLSRLREHLVVVSAADLQTIFLYQSIFAQDNEIFVSLRTVQNGPYLYQNIPDTNGLLTSGIVGIGTGAVATNLERGGFIFAAVRPAGGGIFGDTGSGIVPIIFGDDVSQKDEANMRSVIVLVVIDGPEGTANKTGISRATPLDRTSASVRIGANLASMTVTDIHFDRSMQRLYVGLQATGGAAGSDGARSVVVGRFLDTHALVLSPLAPDAVFAGANGIVGGVGANSSVSANKIRSMFTSTALHYLIVQGGNGTPAATRRTVYALPLVVGNENDALNGTIASKDSSIEDRFSINQPTFFFPEGRAQPSPATTPAQMTLNTDPAALVGGSPLPFGDITDMFVRGDAVFVSVNTPDANQAPGIFYSQALFDGMGKIKGWTVWQRVSGNVAGVTGFGLDPMRGDFIFTTSSASDVRSVRRTNWATEGGPVKSLATAVSTVLTNELGCVQGARDFPYHTPGLTDIAALALLGKETVVLAQTGTNSLGEVPTSSFTLQSFDNGTITQTFPNGGVNAIALSGGELTAIGPLQAVEIARNGNPGTQAWLFVGGINGLAVLSKPDGSGWDPATQLADGFDGITSGMSFKKVGNYRFVRKIISDNQYLYILTDKTLERIDLSQGAIGLGNYTATIIADATGIANLADSDSLLDVLISERFGLLATTGGLFRVGNAQDIRTAQDTAIMHWTPVPFAEDLAVVQKLEPTTSSGLGIDIARFTGGQVYALSAYRGNNQARVHRFAIQPVQSTGITDSTVQLFPDLYTKGIPSFAISFGSLRTAIACDGALLFHARGRTNGVDPLLWLPPVFPEMRSGVRFVGVQSSPLPLEVKEGNSVTALLRNSASGSWLIGGNFGLRVNE